MRYSGHFAVAFAASIISLATSVGCETGEAWSEGIETTSLAFILFAIKRIKSGLIILSFSDIRYQEGLDFQVACSIFSLKTLDVAVNDPELMVSMPPAITAAIGMNALTHAVAAYVSTMATPTTDVAAIKANELISKYLREAVIHGEDIELET